MGESVAPIRGEITEIVGRPSSGRTSYLLACLSHVVGQGETAALVDAEETFDPRSAAQAGIDLRRLLWVRCGNTSDVYLRRVLTATLLNALQLLSAGEPLVEITDILK